MEKTRVNCFALFLLLVLLTGCSSTSGTSATVEELPEEAPSYVTELKVPTVEEVQEINEYVNGLISYGVGSQVEGRPITEEDYLEFGTGDCGIYCYLFVKELSRHGYYQATTYGISSLHIGEDSSIHAVVEVQTTEGPYVFDPTHGIYYTTDMATLLTCDDAQAYACGEPSMDSYYLTNRFFTEAYQVLEQPDSLLLNDLNLLGWYPASVTSSIPVEPASSQDVVYDETLTPNSIFCVFTEDVEFYRITMSFMEELQVPLEVTCWSVDEDGTKTALEGDLVQDGTICPISSRTLRLHQRSWWRSAAGKRFPTLLFLTYTNKRLLRGHGGCNAPFGHPSDGNLDSHKGGTALCARSRV